MEMEFFSEKINPNVEIKILVNNKLNKKHSIAPIAEARNLAILNSTYDNIIVSDFGCRLDKNFIAQMSSSLETNEIVAGRYLGDGDNELQKKLKKIFP